MEEVEGPVFKETDDGCQRSGEGLGSPILDRTTADAVIGDFPREIQLSCLGVCPELDHSLVDFFTTMYHVVVSQTDALATL